LFRLPQYRHATGSVLFFLRKTELEMDLPAFIDSDGAGYEHDLVAQNFKI